MKVISWNVNGLRAAWDKGLPAYLQKERPQIVGLQEVRALPEQLAPEVARPPRWHTAFSAAERKGYSGVALYSRPRPDEVLIGLGEERFDVEGRFQLARFGQLMVVNAYFPNGNGKERDNSRIPYKLDFTKAVFDLLEPDRRKGRPILVMGDFNTAHEDIDLARPKQNQGTSGFTPIEREEISRWIKSGWVDTFRHFVKGSGHYSWWSQRVGVREKNIGWRIDLVLASPGAMPFVRDAFIRCDQRGSDHCPIGVDLDPRALG
jgi:exodeoxyribonuclease III